MTCRKEVKCVFLEIRPPVCSGCSGFREESTHRELSRSSKSIINEEDQAERMREAQKELEQRRHDDPVMGM